VVVAIVLITLAVLAGLVGAFLLRGVPVELRKSRALKRRMKTLDRRRRRDLAGALRRGRAVRDPRDAALAAEMAAQARRMFRKFAYGRIRYAVLAIELILAAGLIARAATAPSLALLIPAIPLLVALGAHALRGRTEQRLHRAEIANRALAEEFPLAEVVDAAPETASTTPASR
jgi:hypothetical protein